MIKSQINPTVNVVPHTDTPLVTDFHTANTPCLFCECGNRGDTICTEATSPRALTILQRETETGHRYTIGTANASNGRGFKPVQGQSKYTMPCAALAGAAKLSRIFSLPIMFTPIDGVDWLAINVEVSTRLYAAGFSAYTESGGDENGWCEIEQRIYAWQATGVRVINIHPSRILDNEVTRQGWDAAAALDEADAYLSRPNFAYDTDIDGAPLEVQYA